MLHLKRNNSYQTVPEYTKRTETAAINDLVKGYNLTVSRIVESPRMIQYRIVLNPDTKVQSLLKMRDNFCIALNDDSVNVFRDKSELIIEKRGADNTIMFGDMMTSHFYGAKGLTLALGKDSEGRNVYTNLEKAPHMLIGGTTGSGKSVMLNTIIVSILAKHRDVSIYAIDTKGTELTRYAACDQVHAISEAEQAIGFLSALCDKMEERYRAFARFGVRDITGMRAAGHKIDSIVVVIDEFADLMLTSGKKVEQYVVRLAQKARAAGIHLVIATQYPTRNVVTGLIKANIPTRVCLKVAQSVNSRVILDRNGGENLTGNGDMLFLANGAFEPIRISGAYIDDDDIQRINDAYRITHEYVAPQTQTNRSIWSRIFGR